MRFNIPVNGEDNSEMDDDYPDFNDDELVIIDENELADYSGEEEEEEDDDDNEGHELGDLAEQHEVRIEKEIIDESYLTFDLHKEPVLCCALNSNSSLGASGGQDDTGYVFETNSGRVLFEFESHRDSIVGVCFNLNDKFVASADMQGFVQVWELDVRRKIFEYELDEDLNWIRWHPLVEDVLLCGTSSGNSWMLKVTDNRQCKVLPSFGYPSTAGLMLNDGRRAAIGYENGCLRIWDLKSAATMFNVHEPFGHRGAITCLDAKKDDSLIASGSLDGTAKLIQSATGKVVLSLDCGRPPAAPSSSSKDADADADGSSSNSTETDPIESLAFSELLNLVATASLGGLVEVWDLSSASRRNTYASDTGVSKIAWDHGNPHLLHAAGLDGVLKLFDARTGKLESTKCGHSDHILDFSLAVNSSLILSASEDTTCRVFRLQ